MALHVSFTDAPFFSLLRSQLTHLGERQKLIAENVSNVDTPGFVPRDTDERAFAQAVAASSGGGKLTMAVTDPGHIGGLNPSIATRVISAPDSETTIDGNSVVLEDQMMKSAETRMAYETNLALYQKGLDLVRLATKPPGR